MAIFSKSLFQSMVDRLEDEARAEETDEPSLEVRGLNAGFVANVGSSSGPGMAVEAAYQVFVFAAEAEVRSMPAYLERLSEDEVAEDLAIGLAESPRDLAARRRAFAQLNHPDCVDPEYSVNATVRMRIANQLIDDAIKAFGRPAG